MASLYSSAGFGGSCRKKKRGKHKKERKKNRKKNMGEK